MNTSAEILSSKGTDNVPKAVLCIGFDEQALEIVRPLVSGGLTLKTISFIDPLAKINAEIDAAAIIFMQWDGVGKKAHTILLSREKKSQNPNVTVHLLLRNKIATPALAPKMAKGLGIASWIEVPQKYYEIQRLLFDLTGAQDEDDEAGAQTYAAGAESTPTLLKSKTLRSAVSVQPPEQAVAAFKSSSLDKEKKATAFRSEIPPEEAGRQMPEERPSPELKLSVPSGADLEASLRRIVDAWKKHTTDIEDLARQDKSFAAERFVVVHPDEAFATEIGLLLEECGVRDVRKPRSIDESMAELRRQATGIILWFDGSSRMVASLLEHLTESRQLTYIPILVILPSRDLAEQLGTKLRGYFFDAICFYDRKASTLKNALEALKRAATTPNTPRSVLEQLRQPLKLESPPERRRAVPLGELETLANKLSERPGKRYWGLSELIPHNIIAGEVIKALNVLKEISSLRPSAFNTLVLRTLVARQTPKKDEATEFLACTVLKIPDVTADRLFRVAQMLERWKALDALAILLNGWADMPELHRDPQLLWMAGRYYLLTKEISKAVPFLAQAAAHDPMRTDYAEGIARILATNHHYDRAASILRFIAKAKDCPWDGKILFPHVLVQSRQIKEASTILIQLLEEAPDNRELLAIKSKINL